MDSISSETTFYLVRHGETEWNVKKILQGHKNSRLTKQGVLQAKQLAAALQDIHFDAVFSSDLGRAKHTAQLLIENRDLKLKLSKLLREKTFGIYDGCAIDVYRNELQQALNEFEAMSAQEQWTYKAHDSMESELEVVERFRKQLRRIAKRHPQKTVLVVTHGGCLRFFLAHIRFASKESLSFGAVSNAGCIKMISDGETFTVSSTTGVTLQE